MFAGKRYCAIPSDGELAVAVGSLSPFTGHPADQVLNLRTPSMDFFFSCALLLSSQYSSDRDGCSRDHQYPVVELLDGRLWPVLLLTKVGSRCMTTLLHTHTHTHHHCVAPINLFLFLSPSNFSIT